MKAYPAAMPVAALVAHDGDKRLMFDASALTKRYASEAGRNRVLALFASASELLVAAHCKTEVASGPTRQYLDPVRYLTNASSGRMGQALALAALELGHEVVVVSGPVSIEYPAACRVVPITTTDQLLAVCRRE